MRGRKRGEWGVGGGGGSGGGGVGGGGEPPPPFPHKSSGRDYSLFGSHFNGGGNDALPSSRAPAPVFTRPPPHFIQGLGEEGRQRGGRGELVEDEEKEAEEAAKARALLREAVEAKRRARTEAITNRW